STLLAALRSTLLPPTTGLLAGDPPTCAQWQRALERVYRPHVLLLNGAGTALPPSLAKGAVPAAGAAAWVCRGEECLPAVHTLADVERLLDG
ncbi:MAG: thioredoxin domain-containing protein, partial [Aromatoleum sp.]|nr:thioredoxin domain-containing protein [Aromatoleum sp.]